LTTRGRNRRRLRWILARRMWRKLRRRLRRILSLLWGTLLRRILLRYILSLLPLSVQRRLFLAVTYPRHRSLTAILRLPRKS
jgi:hypothetical protein